MMIEEFATRTGFKPTFEEYAKIERQYYDFDGDKDEFCANWRNEYLNAKHNALNALLRQLDGIYLTKGKTPEYFAIREIIMGI